MLKIRNDVDIKEFEKFGFMVYKHMAWKRREAYTFDFMKIEINADTKDVICSNIDGRALKRIVNKNCNEWLIENINALKEAELIEDCKGGESK